MGLEDRGLMVGLYLDSEVTGRRAITLGDVIETGATGTVYRLAGDKGTVVKLYKTETTPSQLSEYRDKIAAMLRAPPDLPAVEFKGRRYVQLAWPTAMVVDGRGELRGFAMPEIDTRAAADLASVLQRNERKGNSLPESYLGRVRLALRLAAMIAELHALKHYIVDLKPQNLMFYPDTWYLAILDADGFSINGPSRFPASHFSPEYIAPEVAANKTKVEQLGEEQDLFALAVILFQLLNDGWHPYAGVPVAGADQPSSLQQRIDKGLYAYGLVERADVEPAPASIHDYLEDETRRLFDRAFQLGAPRPSAVEWRDHLHHLLRHNVLVPCAVKPEDHGHFSKGCGLCAFERTGFPAREQKQLRQEAARERERREQERLQQEAARAQLLAQRSRTSLSAGVVALSFLLIFGSVLIGSLQQLQNGPGKDPASPLAVAALAVILVGAIISYRKKWHRKGYLQTKWGTEQDWRFANQSVIAFSAFLFLIGASRIPAVAAPASAVGALASGWALLRVVRNWAGSLTSYRDPFELLGPLRGLVPRGVRSWLGFPMAFFAVLIAASAVKPAKLLLVEPQLGWCVPEKVVTGRSPPTVGLERVPGSVADRIVQWSMQYRRDCLGATFSAVDARRRTVVQQNIAATSSLSDQVVRFDGQIVLDAPDQGDGAVRVTTYGGTGAIGDITMYGCDGKQRDQCVARLALAGPRKNELIAKALLDWDARTIRYQDVSEKGVWGPPSDLSWEQAALKFVIFSSFVPYDKWSSARTPARRPDGNAIAEPQQSRPSQSQDTEPDCSKLQPVAWLNDVRARVGRWEVLAAKNCRSARFRIYDTQDRLLMLQTRTPDNAHIESFVIRDWGDYKGRDLRLEVFYMTGANYVVEGITEYGCGNPPLNGPVHKCMRRLDSQKRELRQAWLWENDRITFTEWSEDPATGKRTSARGGLAGEKALSYLREHFYLYDEIAKR